MKNNLKILLLVLIMTAGLSGRSQTEHGFLPYSNKLLMNPSFAGFNKSTSIWSNLHFFGETRERVNHSFSFTYDKWYDRLKAGTAWYFFQGLEGEVNTNHTGAGFTFSKPVPVNDGEFIPSININYFFYTKQWFVYVLDGVLDKELDPYRPPGVSFMRYNVVTPRMGLLWNTPELSIGLSASYSYRHHIGQMISLPDPQPYHLIFHASQKMRGKQKGLQSRPFKASPELVVLYSGDLLLSRAGFRMEQVGNLMALFVQNNYTDNIHGIATVLGWRSDTINVSLTAGGAYSIPDRRPALFGEISLGLVIPYNFVNDENPWAPPDNSF